MNFPLFLSVVLSSRLILPGTAGLFLPVSADLFLPVSPVLPGSAGFQPAPETVTEPEPRKDSRTPILKAIALLAMPLTLGTYLWLSNPFKDELAKEVYSLSSLSPAQEHNIDKAARAIDGRVVHLSHNSCRQLCKREVCVAQAISP